MKTLIVAVVVMLAGCSAVNGARNYLYDGLIRPMIPRKADIPIQTVFQCPGNEAQTYTKGHESSCLTRAQADAQYQAEREAHPCEHGIGLSPKPWVCLNMTQADYMAQHQRCWDVYDVFAEAVFGRSIHKSPQIALEQPTVVAAKLTRAEKIKIINMAYFDPEYAWLNNWNVGSFALQATLQCIADIGQPGWKPLS